jgi:hypothetical protein
VCTALNAAKQHQDSALAQQAAEYVAKINDWKQKCEALHGMKTLAEQRFQQVQSVFDLTYFQII